MRRLTLAAVLALVSAAAVYSAEETKTQTPEQTLASYVSSGEADAEKRDAALALAKAAQVIRLHYEHDTPTDDPAGATRFALSLKASLATPITKHVDGKTYAGIELVFSTLFTQGEELTPEQWLDQMKRPIEAGYKLAAVEVVLTPSDETKRESLAKSKETVEILAKALEKAKPDFPQLKAFAVDASVIEGRWERGDWPSYPGLHYEHAVGPDRKEGREKLSDDWCSMYFGIRVITGTPSQRPMPGWQYPLQGIEVVWSMQCANENLNELFELLVLAAIQPLEDLEAELRGDEPEPEPIVIRGETYYPISDDEMRKAGFDVPDIPPDENAAFVYYEAINACSGPGSDSPLFDLRGAVLRDGWSAQAAPLTAYLDRNKETLRLLHRAASKDRCYFPIMSRRGTSLEDASLLDDAYLVTASASYVAGMGRLTSLCIVQGKKHEYDGHASEALTMYLLVLRLGNHASCGSLLLNSAVGIGFNTRGLQEIEACVHRNTLTEQALADVQERLHTLSAKRPEFKRAMANERVWTERKIEYVLRNPDAYMGTLGAWKSELRKYDLSREKWEEIMRRDLAAFWQAADEFFDMSFAEFVRSGAPRKLNELVNASEGERPLNMMSIWCSSLGNARTIYGEADLHWTVVDVELALARYRLEHGGYPDRLDELKDLMLSDAIDPFSGKPLNYRLEDDGSFTIWSVGADLTDDGGEVTARGNPLQGDDYVWNSRLLSAGN